MRITLIVISSLLLFAAPASAKTELEMPNNPRYPYKRWINKSLVPTPDVKLRVYQNARKYCGDAGGCASRSMRWIAIGRQQRPLDARLTFMHEIGHVFDFKYIKPRMENRFRNRLNLSPTLPWESIDINNPNKLAMEEYWADFYEICSTQKRYNPLNGLSLGNVARWSGRIKRTCPMINHIYQQAQP